MIDGKVTIQRVETEKKKYRVYTGQGDFLFSEDTVIKYGLFKDKTFTAEEFSEILAAEEYQKLFNKVLRYLSYQERSVKEVETYLNKQSGDSAAIIKIIDKFIAYGYLNDARYAALTLNYVLTSRKGPRYLENRLQLKGVSAELINETLEKYSEEQEKSLVDEIVQDYINKNSEQPKLKLQARLYQKLIRDGFSVDIVTQTIANTKFPSVSRQKLRLDLSKLLLKIPEQTTEAKQKIIKKMIAKGYSYHDVVNVLSENE
ncbi:MAG: RecX family transcriptional regulator [Bacilli bacterium]|nr:RecX family transcriptional regulator [Bacilli bacterium]